MRLKLSPNTVVLHQDDLLKINWKKIDKMFNTILYDCYIEELKPLIVEDSGIDVIKYVNYYGNDLWLQMLNSRAILEAKFSKKPRRLKRGFRRRNYDCDN